MKRIPAPDYGDSNKDYSIDFGFKLYAENVTEEEDRSTSRSAALSYLLFLPPLCLYKRSRSIALLPQSPLIQQEPHHIAETTSTSAVWVVAPPRVRSASGLSHVYSQE